MPRIATNTIEKGDRRRQILEETARIVGERGYHGFGIQELALRCDLTKAGLLYHFHSKDQLLIAVLRDRDFRDGASMSLAGDNLGAIRETLQAIVERNTGQPEMIRLYAMLRAEALNPAHPAHEYFDAREAAALEMFTQMLRGHVVKPKSVARQLLALMSGLEIQWLREGQGFDLVAEWKSGVAGLIS